MTENMACKVRAAIAVKRATGQSWRELSKLYGVKPGTLCRFAKNGYEPKDEHIRAKLGLPVYRPAPTCPKCGEVHTTKRCTANQKRHRTPEELEAAKQKHWARDWEFLASTVTQQNAPTR